MRPLLLGVPHQKMKWEEASRLVRRTAMLSCMYTAILSPGPFPAAAILWVFMPPFRGLLLLVVLLLLLVVMLQGGPLGAPRL